MEIILAILGIVIGFFVWSAVIGTLFATIPVKLKAKRLGLISSVNPVRIAIQFFISAIAISAMWIYAPVMFFSSLIALFKTLFGIPALRLEAIENLKLEYDNIDISKMA